MAEPLTPYDTGEIAEPVIWPSRSRSTTEDFGKVDFDDDEGATVVTIQVARDDTGRYAVHVEPLREDIKVVVHNN